MENSKQFNRYEEIVNPRLKDFWQFFYEGDTASLLIDPYREVNLFTEFDSQNREDILYYDLSKINAINLSRIFDELLEEGVKGVIFDNIDEIPQKPDSYLIEQMVKDALRKERSYYKSAPGHYRRNTPVLDFKDYMVGARCKNWPPEYLEGVSLLAIPHPLGREFNEDWQDEDEV